MNSYFFTFQSPKSTRERKDSGLGSKPTTPVHMKTLQVKITYFVFYVVVLKTEIILFYFLANQSCEESIFKDKGCLCYY